MKFEHRNYLPALLLFLPLVSTLLRRGRRFGQVALAGWLLLLAVFTLSHAGLWGRPLALTTYWALKNPDSYRAQVVAASQLQRAGHTDLALDVLARANARHPQSPALRLTYANLLQAAGQPDSAMEQLNKAIIAIQQGPVDTHIKLIVDSLVDAAINRPQGAFTRGDIERVITAFTGRPAYFHAKDRALYATARARLALAAGDLDAACPQLRTMQRASGTIGTDLLIVAYLASAGYYPEASSFLEAAAAKIPLGAAAGLRFPPAWYEREIARLAANLVEDQGSQPAAPARCLALWAEESVVQPTAPDLG